MGKNIKYYRGYCGCIYSCEPEKKPYFLWKEVWACPKDKGRKVKTAHGTNGADYYRLTEMTKTEVAIAKLAG